MRINWQAKISQLSKLREMEQIGVIKKEMQSLYFF
jgi:hypothetical protein